MPTRRTTEPSPDPPDLVDGLVQASFVTMAVLNRVGAEHDLSLTQMRVLGILRDRRLRMTALADYLGLEKSTLSGLVDRAATRGLLERRASETDGRAVEVVLTRAGRTVARRVYVEIGQALAAVTDELSPVEGRRLAGLLDRMLAPGRIEA